MMTIESIRKEQERKREIYYAAAVFNHSPFFYLIFPASLFSLLASLSIALFNMLFSLLFLFRICSILPSLFSLISHPYSHLFYPPPLLQSCLFPHFPPLPTLHTSVVELTGAGAALFPPTTRPSCCNSMALAYTVKSGGSSSYTFRPPLGMNSYEEGEIIETCLYYLSFFFSPGLRRGRNVVLKRSSSVEKKNEEDFSRKPSFDGVLCNASSCKMVNGSLL